MLDNNGVINMSKYKFSLPRLDITGVWVFSLGLWFHIVARLGLQKALDGFLSGRADCGHSNCLADTRILDTWIARVSREERELWKPAQAAICCTKESRHVSH